MGGFGALRFGFTHPELFGSVSAESAALITITPEELNAAQKSDRPVGRLLGGVFGNPINLAHWKQNDVFAIAKHNSAALRTLGIYFNCGDKDEFGFDAGARALDAQLKRSGVPHEFHIYPGHHDATYFLGHLGEAVEFHNRYFEGRSK